jgi:hypothetical protein
MLNACKFNHTKDSENIFLNKCLSSITKRSFIPFFQAPDIQMMALLQYNT